MKDNKNGFDDTASCVFVIVLIKIGYAMFQQNDRKKERTISEFADSLALFCSNIIYRKSSIKPPSLLSPPL